VQNVNYCGRKRLNITRRLIVGSILIAGTMVFSVTVVSIRQEFYEKHRVVSAREHSGTEG